ncbi:hypothetical protein EDC44_101155 [Cricetibacter osteomyelitidis]|uniref:Uncharacterized protein n=1 Tax=Cricetibacter osteomyelitidis TaxID=1521931 RepID=A0A4R2TRV5_9PAST|nr:hypothetical protein [Cricetibacter osteomyelitidis]TCP97772.1 hypothetical protein EDC44_101155 [Cricetibacter osteomyelitidis]
MKLEKIYKNLGYSFKKNSEDEIEIRTSFPDAVFRGIFRAFVITIILFICLYTNGRYQKPFFSPIIDFYYSMKKDFEWGYMPDRQVKPMYDDYLMTVTSPTYSFPNDPIESYEEYKEGYNKRIFKYKFIFLSYFLWIIPLLFLFFFPRNQGVILNRKHRVIVVRNIFFGNDVFDVPENGDPIAYVPYDRFAMFTVSKKSPLFIFAGVFIGVYPSPSPEHSMHIIKAARAYFKEENPEFLNYIGKRYRFPWTKPCIAFCNLFTLFDFARFNKTTTEQVIDEFKQQWAKTPELKKVLQREEIEIWQAERNQLAAMEGLKNNVNDDWYEIDTSIIYQKEVE